MFEITCNFDGLIELVSREELMKLVDEDDEVVVRLDRFALRQLADALEAQNRNSRPRGPSGRAPHLREPNRWDRTGERDGGI